MGWQDRPYNRDDGGLELRFGFTPPGRMTLFVLAACFVVFLAQSFSAASPAASPLVRWFSLSFEHGRAFTQPWRWVTYQYLHADPLHIFFNLLMVYFFLNPLEQLWGGRKALAFYTLGGVAAGVLFGILSLFVANMRPLVGASGSIMAALGACALLFPEKRVLLIVIPIPIRVLAILLGLLFVLTVVGRRDLSDAAHLGGLAFGFAAPYYLRPVFARLGKRMMRDRVKRLAEAEQAEAELVDRILQKVSDHGMHSLTRLERRALKKATEHQRQRDMEVSRARRGAMGN